MNARAAPSVPADLLPLLAGHVPALIAYYEAVGFRCVFANGKYAEMFGFDERSIIGRTFREVIGEAAADRIQPLVDHVLEQHVATSYEREIDDASGGTRWIEVHLLPHLEGDALRGAFVLINDITRHRSAEVSLRESEERLAKFMQASREGIVFHKDGFITDANPPILRAHRLHVGRTARPQDARLHCAGSGGESCVGDRVGAGDGLRERGAAQGRHAHRRRVHRAHDGTQRRALAHDDRARHPRPP